MLLLCMFDNRQIIKIFCLFYFMKNMKKYGNPERVRRKNGLAMFQIECLIIVESKKKKKQ